MLSFIATNVEGKNIDGSVGKNYNDKTNTTKMLYILLYELTRTFIETNQILALQKQQER